MRKDLKRVGNYTRILVGDFNLPGYNWQTMEAHPASTFEREAHTCLVNITDNLVMEETVQGPTRGNNSLDLVFTSNHNLVHHVEVSQTAISDHKLVEVVTKFIRKVQNMKVR